MPITSGSSSASNTEVLEDNIAIWAFSVDFTHPGIVADVRRIKKSLADIDALIIDLSDAEDSSASVSQLIASYFLKSGTLIGDVHSNELLPLTKQ